MQPSYSAQTNDPSSPLIEAYNALTASGQLQDDTAQRHILRTLDDIRQRLMVEEAQSATLLEKLFSFAATPDQAPKGLYIWGGVGRGKSMLMDLFFEHTPIKEKRRIHFHQFMQDVHARIHELRQTDRQNAAGADPVVMLSKEMASSIRLLCFDELQADDVADATLLFRLFGSLWSHGMTIVTTSNHPPESLYTGGVQKERFDNFIRLIKEHMQVESLDSPRDYRERQEADSERRYFYPLGPAAEAFVDGILQSLGNPTQETLDVKGRTLPFILYNSHIGRFSFAELCEQPLGAADYLAITARCDTIILMDIPQLSTSKRNEAKRFVTLIDALYESKTRLICTAAAAPEQLYPEGDGAFEFRRTVSRLLEMQSEQWNNK